MIRLILTLLLLAAVGVAALAYDASRVLQGPLQIEEDTTLIVEEGLPFATLAHRFTSSGWLASPPRGLWYLRLYARWQGVDTRVKAGEYRLPKGSSMLQVLDMMVAGQTVLHELRLVEGWTFRQAMIEIRNHAQLRHTLPPDADVATIMREAGREGVHPEGRLFPDTYRFSRGMTDVAFLRRAMDMMDRVLAEEWERREEGLPYATAEEALVMASIVEKETGAPEERGEVAGVFVRRLNLGMRLQTDPTVIYGIGERFDGNLRRVDLRTDTEYNTYTRAGLPPTPICLPGRASIRAALHPLPGTTLFFVSRGDGTHVFSETLEQHNAAVRRYQLGQK